MPDRPTPGGLNEKDRKTMSDFKFTRLLLAVSATVICLGISYCSSKVFAPVPVLKLAPGDFKFIPKEPN
jgi:hypothetical protein